MGVHETLTLSYRSVVGHGARAVCTGVAKNVLLAETSFGGGSCVSARRFYINIASFEWLPYVRQRLPYSPPQPPTCLPTRPSAHLPILPLGGPCPSSHRFPCVQVGVAGVSSLILWFLIQTVWHLSFSFELPLQMNSWDAEEGFGPRLSLQKVAVICPALSLGVLLVPGLAVFGVRQAIIGVVFG